MELVNLRNQVIHLENYADKLKNLRSVVNKVFNDLQRLLVQAHDQALKNLFKEVIKSMEVVEVKRNRKLISDFPHYVYLSKMIPEAVRSGLDTSWMTQVLVKPKKPILKALKMKEPEEEKFVEKLQEELLEQKSVSETLRRQLAEVKEKQKHQRAIQEAQVKRTEDLENIVKEQSLVIKTMVATLLDMMKKQQQP